MDLVDIKKAATADNAALLLHPSDTVAIARVPLSPGQSITPGGHAVTAIQPIEAGHKLSLRAVRAGEMVLRYGQPIGRARCDIAPGEHVHTHNLAYEDVQPEYEFPTEDHEPAAAARPGPTWMGYPRADGRAGTRNYIAVVAASNCSAHVVEQIAASYRGQPLPPNVDGVVAFPHGDGCGHSIGPDTDQLRRTLRGVIDHPNVSGALMLGLGCEVNQVDDYLAPPSRLTGLTLQQSGGTRATIEQARAEIARLFERASAEKRAETSITKITLGLNCGGSDSFSGITANPALGRCCDWLAGMGATFVLAETPEITGAEHLLVRRARSRAVAEKLLAQISEYRAYLARFGGSFDDNPSPGNKKGGLTTILEKSLGAAAKAGGSPLNEVAAYAERVQGPGFVFMNTPGYDPVSLAGLGAGGVNLIAFTTGRGSAIGFPTVPVLKISTNSSTYARMRDNMDINAGRIGDGDATVDELAQEILDAVLATAAGRRTCSEVLGHQEFVPWRIGPVL